MLYYSDSIITIFSVYKKQYKQLKKNIATVELGLLESFILVCFHSCTNVLQHLHFCTAFAAKLNTPKYLPFFFLQLRWKTKQNKKRNGKNKL